MADEKKSVEIRMSDEDWNKLLAYCHAADPNEIIGLAHAEIRGGHLHVFDPFILKQEVAGASCEIDQKALVDFVGSYEHIAKVKVIWHSHVRMQAFFSSCDRDTSEKLSALGKLMTGQDSWFISIVANIMGNYQAKVDMYKPFEASLDGIIKVVSAQNDKVISEVKELVSSRSYSGGNWKQSDYFRDKEEGKGGVVIYGGKGKRKKEKSETHYSEDDIFNDLDPHAHLGGES